MPENTVLSYPTWFAYGVGHVLNDMCASLWFSYFLVFFHYVLEIDSGLTGKALAIGQFADGVSTQVVGIFSDKRSSHWICRYGRRKTWHLIGTICVFFSFPFIFSPYYGFQHLDEDAQVLYYSVFIVVFQFGWAAIQISHLSLVPDLTPHQHERTGLLSLRYSFTVLSNIAAYAILCLVLDKEKVMGPNDKPKFQLVACTVVILGSITSLIFHVGVKEKHHHSSSEADQSALLPDETPSRGSLFCNLEMYKVACTYVATRLFFNLSQIYITYYLQAYLILPSKNQAILPLVMFISSFATSSMIKPLNVEFGRKVTYVIGGLIGIGACIWVRVGKVDDDYYRSVEIYGVVIAFGCAGSILLVTSLGVTADLIGPNTHYGAFVMGLMSFGDKISNGVAVLLIENLRPVDSSTCYYRDVLSLCCSTAAIFGMLSMLSTNSGSEISAMKSDSSVSVFEPHNKSQDDAGIRVERSESSVSKSRSSFYSAQDVEEEGDECPILKDNRITQIRTENTCSVAKIKDEGELLRSPPHNNLDSYITVD